MTKPSQRQTLTFISGHRNPDVDSIMSAVGLADLKRRLGESNVTAICPGLMPEKAAWLFEHFNIEPPQQRNDVCVRTGDLMHTDFESIPADASLFTAVRTLRETHSKSLPVIDEAGKYLGMLSPLSLLSELLNIGSDEGRSFTGREIFTSCDLIQKILEAELLSGEADTKLTRFDVFVAAMSPEFFEKHMMTAPNEPAVIVGDRPEIHLRVLQKPVKLLIITGNCPVESTVIELAKLKKVTILRSKYDSATVIRRLKFGTPVRYTQLNKKVPVLSQDELIRDIRPELMSSRDDVFPVCAAQDCTLLGVILRSDLTAPPPFRMILVDHNETDQGIAGLEDLPIIEVVDHHRIGMNPTAEPIRFTADTVGSTCTLVSNMFRAAGQRPTRGLAGLLLGGIITDTLLFQSPTTTKADHTAAEWLESIANEKSADLMKELMNITSLLAIKTAGEVIAADRKNYHENGYSFALSQVEENNLELLSSRKNELSAEMENLIHTDSLDFIGLLVTDPVRGNSVLMIAGNPRIIRALPYRKRSDGLFLLPGVLSRKKQLLPQILSVTAALKKG